MTGNFYEWKCNRCETSARGDYRDGLQRFIDHHVTTMHPLFTAERIGTELFVPVSGVQGSQEDE